MRLTYFRCVGFCTNICPKKTNMAIVYLCLDFSILLGILICAVIQARVTPLCIKYKVLIYRGKMRKHFVQSHHEITKTKNLRKKNFGFLFSHYAFIN